MDFDGPTVAGHCEPCGSSSVLGMTVGVPSHVRLGESEVNTRGELFEKLPCSLSA